MSKSYSVLLSLVLVMIAAFAVVAPAAAQSADVAVVTLQVAQGETPEENVQVNVELVCETETAVPLFSCFADITYNPAELTVNSITAGANYGTFTQGDTSTPGVINGLGGVASHTPITAPGNSNVVATINVTPLVDGTVTMTPAADADSEFTELTIYDFDGDFRDTATYTPLNMNVVPDAAPSITSTSPVEGGELAIGETILTFNFSEAMFIDQNETLTFGVTCDSANPSIVSAVPVSPPDTSAFNIGLNSGQLTPGDDCTFSVGTSALIDSADQVLQDTDGTADGTFMLNFSIESLPEIVDVVPASGSTNVDANTDITITTTKQLYAAGTPQLTCGGVGQPYTLAVNSATEYVINPNAALPEGASCTFAIPTAIITDAPSGQGNNLVDGDGTVDGTYNIQFSTGPGPQITSTLPADGTIDVPVGSNMAVTFDALGFAVVAANGPFTFTCDDGSTVQDLSTNLTIILAASPPNTFTLDVDDFLTDATCTLSVPTGYIQDSAGNLLEDDDGNDDGAYTVVFDTEAAAPPLVAAEAGDGPVIESVAPDVPEFDTAD